MMATEKNSQALKIFILFILFSVGDIFCVVPVETGKNYTFKPSATGTPETILWKYNKNKVVEYENNKDYWYRFKGRADLDTKTGDFTLKQLSKEDSGQYESEIQVDGKLQYSNHEIEVMDPVTKPIVTCETNILRCSLSPQVQADFEWKGPDSFTHSGQTVNITQKPSPGVIYYCTAKNVVSEESTQFDLKDCLEGGGGLSGGYIVLIIVGIICVGGLAFLGYKKFPRKNDREPVSNK